MDLWPAPCAPEPVVGTAELPGSKSLTNRALLLSAISDGPSTVRRALRSRDTELMAAALTSLGAFVDTSGDDWRVTPIAADADGDVAVDCGLAGTVMRFVPPIAGLRRGIATFDGDAHARTRPMAAMLTALRGLGMEIDDGGRGALPFSVAGNGRVSGGSVEIDASASSQFVSALLLAAPRYDAGIAIRHTGATIPSQPHLDMTVACLRERGVSVDDATPGAWTVTPGPVAALDTTIEPDLSNAAPFLMVALTTGGRVTIPGWPASTTQPGDALRDILTAMGATVAIDDDGLTITATGSIHGIDLDLHDLGELTPAIAALCALADSPSYLRGIAHIRGHETDRLNALAREINNLGGDVTETDDGLEIRPKPLHGGSFATYGDHRMAHAAVILGSVTPGVGVENIGTTGKTFPGFEHVWARLLAGAR